MIRPPFAALTACLLAASSAEDIDRAIRQLGDRRFVVRENAQKSLVRAGTSAEAALRAALSDPDPEVVRRARELLDRLEWGLAADTPPAVAALINRYRGGDDDAKSQAVRELVELGKPAFPALLRLTAKADSAELKQLLGNAITEAARGVVPKLLLEGDLTAAEQLLEAALVGDGEEAIGHYVALADLTKRSKELAGQWKQKSTTPTVCEVLAAFARAAGDWAEAERHARLSGRDDLLESVQWERGDWTALATRPIPPELRRLWYGAGLTAAYQRLAGLPHRFNKTVEELKEAGRGDDPYERRGAAESLLLNRRPDDALRLLDHPLHAAFRFELLAARLRYADALKLARIPAPGGPGVPEDDPHLELARIRVHGLVGETAEAEKLARQFAAKLVAPGDANPMADLIKLELRAGRRTAALAHAAAYLQRLTNLAIDERRDPIGQVLTAAYPRRGAAAVTWWRYFAAVEAGDPAAQRLARIEGVLDPPRGAAPAADLIAALVKSAGDQPGEIWRCRQAAAVAWSAAHLPERAGAEYRAAARQLQTPEAWTALGDHQIEQRDYPAAASSYAEAWNRDRTKPLPLYLLGDALHKAGRADEGREKSDLAFRLSLGAHDERAKLADDLGKRGLSDAARREREFVLRVGGYRGTRQWYVGNVLNQLSRDAAARRDYAKAADYLERSLVGCLRTGAQYIEASAYLTVPQLVHAYRARAELVAGRLDAALAEVNTCLDIAPGAIDLAIQVVPELEKQNRKADADAIYERVVGAYRELSANFPESAFAHNSYAWTAANCRRDLDAALHHAKEAVRLSPRTSGYLDTLSEVHFRRGERAAAVAGMRKCLEMDPGNAYYRRQLARFERGDAAEAPSDEDAD